MTTTVQAPRQFKADFIAVCRKNNCPPEEVKVMTELARNDLDAAVQSFGIMAGEI